MPDGDPIRIGGNNLARPGAETLLRRDLNSTRTDPVFTARTQVGGDAIHGEAVDDTGVLGTSSSDGIGVEGHSVTGQGVRGTSADGWGVIGYSRTGTGMIGSGRQIGVRGGALGQGTDAADPTVYAGVLGQGGDFGVYCQAPLGLHSESTRGAGGRAAYFKGPVFVEGEFTVLAPHPKSVAVPHPDGTLRKLYTLESPESWLEDFGRAEVIEGHARVELDGDFAAIVDTDDYHVFVTPEGESKGLYVSERTPRDFEVREQGEGTSTLAFSYRIVVKRKDVEAERLEIVERPPVRTLDVVEPPDLEQESQ